MKQRVGVLFALSISVFVVTLCSTNCFPSAPEYTPTPTCTPKPVSIPVPTITPTTAIQECLMAHSWEIAVKPSSREGWCSMEGLGNGGYYYSLLYPASWVVGTIGANIPNLDFDIGSEGTVVRLYRLGGNSLPLEQADKGYAYCDPTGYCEPIVDPDEQEISRTIKMVGNRQALVLVTSKDDIVITRYFFQLSFLIKDLEETDLYEFRITTPKSNLGSSEYIELLSTVEEVILLLASNE